jgi:hypothetical protein
MRVGRVLRSWQLLPPFQRLAAVHIVLEKFIWEYLVAYQDAMLAS